MDAMSSVGGYAGLAQLLALQRLADTPGNIAGLSTDTRTPPRPPSGVQRISATGTDLYL